MRLHVVPPLDVIRRRRLIQQQRLPKKATYVAVFVGLQSLNKAASSKCHQLGPFRSLFEEYRANARAIEHNSSVGCMLGYNIMKHYSRIKIVAGGIWLNMPDQLHQTADLFIWPTLNMSSQYTKPFERRH